MGTLSLLVCAFAFQSVVLGTLLGANKCTYGPSYWCASFENAKECSATQHCLRNNWVKAGKPVYVREETACTFCKDMVNDVHELVTSSTDKSKALVESYLGRSCSYMSDEFSKAQCEKISTHYLDEFVALVQQRVNAGVICSLLKLCPESRKVARTASVKPVYQPMVGNGTACTKCKEMVNKIHSFVLNNSATAEARAREYLNETCALMPDDYSKEKCLEIGEHYIKEVIAIITAGVDAEMICTLFHLCHNDTKPTLRTQQIKVNDETPCELCKDIVASVQKFVTNNSATAKAKASAYINMVCDRCPDDFGKAECKKIGEHYLDELIAMVEVGVDPDVICSLLKLCNGTSSSQLMVKVKDETPCDLCKDMVNDVRHFVVNDSATAKAKAMKYVEQICEKIPDEFAQGECEKIGSHYLDTLIAMIKSGIDADVICSFFKLCINNARPVVVKVKDETPCDLCKDMVNDVRHFVANDSATARAKAMKYVEQICEKIPDEFAQGECEKIGSHYLDTLIAMIKSGIDADVICSFFKLCINNARPVVVKDETPCDLCKDMVNDVRHFVVNDSATARAKVVKYLEQICAKFPDGYAKDQCEYIGEHYTDTLIAFIKNKLDADDICWMLGLCKDSRRPVLSKVYVSNGTVCAMCKQMVNRVHQFLLNNSDAARAQAEQYLNQTCHLMPDDFSRAECQKIGEHYVEIVIALIKAGVDAEQICSVFHLCNSEIRPLLSKVKVKDETPCELCKDIVASVQKFVTNNSATAKAKASAYINMVCDRCPDDFGKAECKKIGEHYLDELIAMVEVGVDPDVICSLLKLCNGTSSSQLMVKDETPCDLCKDMVKDVRQFVVNDSATAKAKAMKYVEQICEKIPDEFAQGECEKIGSHYLDTLIAMIKSGIDADVICSFFKLCINNARPVVVKDTPECEECKKAEQSIRTWVDNKDNQKKMADFLQAQCVKMGGDMAAECQTIVSKILPEFISLIDSNLDGQLCAALHICHSPVDVIGAAQQSLIELIKKSDMRGHIEGLALRKDKDMCTECEEVFTYIHIFMRDNASQAQIEQMVENTICTKLGAFSGLCKHEVAEHFTEIWNLMLQSLDPKKICVAVKLCNATSVAAPAPKPTAITPECVICEFLIHELESHFVTPGTEEEMKAAMEKACSELPGTWSKRCDAFVDEYGVDIIELIIEKVAPEVICSMIGACVGDSRQKAAEAAAKQAGVENCVMCEMAVAYLKSSLGKNATQAELTGALARLCAKLPDNLAHQCGAMIEQYAPTMFKLIGQDITSGAVCAVKDTPECEECKKAEQSIRTWVDNKDNQKKMADFLQAQCVKMGGDMAAECQTIVAKILPEFISLIDSNLNGQLCAALHICHSPVDVIAAAQQSLIELIKKSGMRGHIEGLASRTGTDLCTECEEVFNYIHIFMRNNASQAQVEKAIEDYICTELGEFAGLCQGAVHDYFPQIWTQLVRLLDPRKVCLELRMCNETSVVAAELESHPTISVECVLCEFIIHELESKYITPSSEEQLEADMNKICNLIPGNLSVECHKFVDKDGAKIIKLIFEEVAPGAICAMIRVCPGDAQRNLAEAAAKQAGVENCVMCEMAVAYLKSSLGKNATQAELTGALARLCAKLPDNLAHQCGAMIEQYAPTMFKLIGQDITSGAVCAEMGLCQQSAASRETADGLVHLYNRSSNV